MSPRHPACRLPLLWLLAALALAGCSLDAGQRATPAPVQAAAATPTAARMVASEPTQAYTATLPATATPQPTATVPSMTMAVPSDTPIPSATASPSPTPTPLPPTPAPLVPGKPLDLSLGWRLDANGHLAAGIASTGSMPRILLASLGRTVYAVNARGEVAWHQKTPGPVYALASTAGGGVAAGDDAGFVSLFDAGGQRLWRVDLGTRVTAVAAAPGGVGGVIAGGWDEKTTWLDADGSMLWQADAGGPLSAIAVLPSPVDLVVVGTIQGQVRAYDIGRQEVWRLELGAPVAALGSLPDEREPLLLAALQDGRLAAIDVGGSPAWGVAFDGGAPVWQAVELSPESWSIVAGTAGAAPSLVHLSAAGDVRWRVSMPAAVTAVQVLDLDPPGGDGSADTLEIAAGLATGEVIVCDVEGRQRAAVHAGLPVWGLGSASDGSLWARADVVAWQIRPASGRTGSPWLDVPPLAPAHLGPEVIGEAAGTSEATLLFLGDVSPGRSMEAQLLRHGSEYPWDGLAPLLAGPEGTGDGPLLIVNLEAVLTTRGEALPKPYVIRAHPVWGEMLSAGGVGLASLANNHVLDYGIEGLDDTLDTLDTLGIATVGAGTGRDDAHRPARFTINGVRIAVLAYAAARWDGSADVPHTDRIAWATPSQVAADVRAVRTEVDLVVVLLHAGTEYATTPSADQVAAAHAAVDAGASLIVGHHPHVTQTVERYGEGLIVYSLGDAVFDIPRQAAMRGHLLRVKVGREGIHTAELWPFWIDAAIQPRLLVDDAGGTTVGVVRRSIYR